MQIVPHKPRAAALSYAAPRRRWNRERFWVTAVCIVIIGSFIYFWADEKLTSGIHRQGDLLFVDLKAMSSFEMNQDRGVTEDIPAVYRDLDGKRVMLIGQMWDPYAADGRLCNFTLVYSINNCCFNGPPRVQHLVQATVLPGRNVDYTSSFVSVTGTLHVGVQYADGHVQSVFRIDVERLDRE